MVSRCARVIPIIPWCPVRTLTSNWAIWTTFESNFIVVVTFFVWLLCINTITSYRRWINNILTSIFSRYSTKCLTLNFIWLLTNLFTLFEKFSKSFIVTISTRVISIKPWSPNCWSSICTLLTTFEPHLIVIVTLFVRLISIYTYTTKRRRRNNFLASRTCRKACGCLTINRCWLCTYWLALFYQIS